MIGQGKELAQTKRYADDGCRLTDCCGAYSTFFDGELACKKCYEDVEFGEGDGSEYLDRDLVNFIRTICVREFGSAFDFPFFKMDYLPGESADAALVRIFSAERKHHATDKDTVMVMIYG